MKHVYNLTRQSEDERDLKLAYAEPAELPRKADLRDKCPPVFDQGKIGSCTANAGVAAYMMLKGTADAFSRLFLYYEERRLEGTTGSDAGATMRSIGKALYNAGVCGEPLWPYVEEKYDDDPPEEADKDADGRKIAAYRKLPGLDDIKKYIAASSLPVMIGMEVYESFESDAAEKTGVIPMPDTDKEALLGGHAVLVVGYDDDFGTSGTATCGFFCELLIDLIDKLTGPSDGDGCLIVRNSWGTGWGDKGYFYLPYAYVKKHAFDFWVIE